MVCNAYLTFNVLQGCLSLTGTWIVPYSWRDSFSVEKRGLYRSASCSAIVSFSVIQSGASLTGQWETPTVSDWRGAWSAVQESFYANISGVPHYFWELLYNGNPTGFNFGGNAYSSMSLISVAKADPNCRDCPADSCLVDCATAPNGFCCLAHSLTDRLIQVLQN